MAIEPEFIEKEINSAFKDIEELVSEKLNEKEVFYFASFDICTHPSIP